jgi:hypothetical protein
MSCDSGQRGKHIELRGIAMTVVFKPASVSAARTKRPVAAGRLHHPRSFLDGLRLDHGPVADIGRFLLAAENAVAAFGITLSFARTAELVALQENNEVSWPLLAPWMSAKFAPLSDDNSYCLLGRNAQGKVVASQAGRIYRLGDRTLRHIVDDHSMIYGKPTALVGQDPFIRLAAPAAAKLGGKLVYSGALWVDPAHRGNKLAALLPRISRAYAHGRFGTETTFCFVSDQIAASPLFAMYGYTNRQQGFSLWEGEKCVYEASLLWMQSAQLVSDMLATREQLNPQINPAVGASSRDNVINAVG